MNGASYQAISAPILSPTLAGWVVFAVRLDDKEMGALTRLSSIPLQASVMHREADGWRSVEKVTASDRRTLSRFADKSLGSGHGQPGELSLKGGTAITLVKPLASMDARAPSVLVLRYPRALALAPYTALLAIVAAVGLGGFAILILGTWSLARSLTRPITALSLAAQRLQAGEDVTVEKSGDDEVGRLAETFNTMAGEIRAREKRITHLALHDAETDLPNRLALEQKINALQKAGGLTFVVSCGVDRFAEVRGAIGYALTGRVVGELGKRLAGSGLCAAVGRLSSDRIGAVFNTDNVAAAQSLAGRIVTALERPLNIDGATIDINLTLGLAALPLHGKVAGAVVDRASIALDQARRKRIKTALFDEALYGEPAENLSLISEMQEAMQKGGVTVHYQPKLDLRKGAVTSAEALVRWTHAKRGPLSPELFVGMAEETGHIRHLTNFVLERAMDDQAMLAKAGHELSISVNMSGRLLGDEAYGRSLLKQIRRRSGPLCLEITETAVIENEAAAFKLLDALRDEGVEISIDDYGSGLSSLAYLKIIRAHELKIDRAFISDMARSDRDALLVRSTIDLAHGLGMRVTAEGVEDDVVLSLLTVMGCDQAQGFGIARPMPVNDLLRFVADNNAIRSDRTKDNARVEDSSPGGSSGVGADSPRLRSA